MLSSFGHHGLFDLEIRATGDLEVDEHHTVEDVALVLGSAFAEALGDRAGIVRFGDARVPMDESLASAVVDVGGRPYAVIDLPFRGERVGELPLQLIEHALEAFSRTAGTTLHLSRLRAERPPPGRGRIQGARTGDACGLRAGSAPDGRRVDEGQPRLMAAIRIAIADYGAGNMVSIARALETIGASVTVATDPDGAGRRRCARGPRRRGGGPGDGPPRAPWAGRADP